MSQMAYVEVRVLLITVNDQQTSACVAYSVVCGDGESDPGNEQSAVIRSPRNGIRAF